MLPSWFGVGLQLIQKLNQEVGVGVEGAQHLPENRSQIPVLPKQTTLQKQYNENLDPTNPPQKAYILLSNSVSTIIIIDPSCSLFVKKVARRTMNSLQYI